MENRFLTFMFSFLKNFFLLLILLFCSVACTHTSKSDNVRFYPATRQNTWEALVYIFKSYPIKKIDADKGYIETEVLKGSNYWVAPHEKGKNINGLSAVIKVRLFYEKPYSKVEIQKTISKRANFVSKPKIVDSDFLEEKSLLYRLKRELYIRRGFNKISR